MKRLAQFLPALICLAALGCRSASPPSATGQSKPQLFHGASEFRKPVTTSSKLAQKYVNQGFVWLYAFNHDEAIRSFTKAAELDPDCPMAWWGIAYANGPHINNAAVEPDRAAAAWAAVKEAQKRASHGTATEQAMIRAVAQRYADPHPADRRPLDEAYAKAMKDVWHMHRDDPDVGTLYAEAMMNLQPWDLWTLDGQPKGNTLEIVAVLEQVMRMDKDHPGANHLYIHAVEASPYPEKGIASADVLRKLVPISGHLTHMPSHIDVQTGRWSLAADQNIRAIQSDQRYRKLAPRQGFYHVYMAHNHHFLAFASMMEGRSATALKAAREMIAGVPAEFIRDRPAWVDPMMGIETDVLKRFGRWDDVLAMPQPPGNLPITTAMWHFNRGLAFAAKGQIAQAEDEQKLFKTAAAKIPAGATMAINPADKIMKIADHMLTGEIEFRKGRVTEAVASLREGVKLEDTLLYMEPPDWIQPVRHTLGAVLVSGGMYDEAEKVYREDLERWPENGWSLYGLASSLGAQGKTGEARDIEARFRKAFARADVKIGASCLCVSNRTARANP